MAMRIGPDTNELTYRLSVVFSFSIVDAIVGAMNLVSVPNLIQLFCGTDLGQRNNEQDSSENFVLKHLITKIRIFG